MEEHYKPKVLPPSSPKACQQRQDFFEEHLELLAGSKEGGNEGGWRSELRDYLKYHPLGVHKYMDILKWWAVSNPSFSSRFLLLIDTHIGQCQNLPHPCKDRPRHSCCPRIIHPMRVAFLSRQIDLDRSPYTSWS